MKTFLLFFIFCPFFVEKHKEKTSPNYNNINEITTVFSHDFRLYMGIHLDCNSINILDTDYHYKLVISNKVKIKKIMNFISESTLVSPVYHDISAVGKMFIYYKSGKIDSICFANTGLFLQDGRIMELKNDSLLNMIEDMQPEK